jgi:hypothetical protein
MADSSRLMTLPHESTYREGSERHRDEIAHLELICKMGHQHSLDDSEELHPDQDKLARVRDKQVPRTQSATRAKPSPSIKTFQIHTAPTDPEVITH